MTNPRAIKDSYEDSTGHSRSYLEHTRSKALGAPELLSHIFSYLDYEELQSCRNVSQHWRDVVLRYFFNDNLGNSPRIVTKAVSENSTTLAMKTLRFDLQGISRMGGRVLDVQRDGDRTFVTVQHKKAQSSAVMVYEGTNLKQRIAVDLPRDAKEFYTMVGKKIVAVVSSNGKGSLNVRSLDRFTLVEEKVFGARMHLLNFFPEKDEMWFVKEDALVSKRRLVLIGVPLKSGAIRRESVDIGKIIPKDDSMFSADFDDIVLDRYILILILISKNLG